MQKILKALIVLLMPIKLFILTFALFINNIFAQSQIIENLNVEIKTFENNNFQDFTTEDLTNRLHETKQLLPVYKCNNKNEFKLFWTPYTLNPEKNSLRIRLPGKDEVDIIAIDGKYYRQDQTLIAPKENSFLKEIAADLKNISKVSEGKQLLSLLQSSPYPITIVSRSVPSFNPQPLEGMPFGFGMNMANAIAIFKRLRMQDTIPFDDIGVGGKISWDPTPYGNSPLRSVILGHELYHAFDSIRGLLDPRTMIDAQMQSMVIAEYRAIYFENIIREATSMDRREILFNKNQKPILFPSQCL